MLCQFTKKDNLSVRQFKKACSIIKYKNVSQSADNKVTFLAAKMIKILLLILQNYFQSKKAYTII